MSPESDIASRKPTTADIAEARKWAAFYRLRGFHPLPSRPDKKQPMVKFAHLWEASPDPSLFDRFETGNCQVMTGRHWGLLVLDLDGDQARQWIVDNHLTIPRTWVVHTGGDGYQAWFKIPPKFTRPIRHGFLWRGEDKHQAVERLCDKSLAMAPPSIHPKHGTRYRWLDGIFPLASNPRGLVAVSPLKMGTPAPCPRWLLEYPTLAAPKAERLVVPLKVSATPLAAGTGRYRASDVRDAIPDIIGLVASWGVRFGTDTGREYVPCYAISRDERNPSAGVSRITGSYNDKATGESLGLFDLAATLGMAADWKEAVASLGDRYHARQTAIAS